ncbi:hypothetical protein [Pseudomonas sp. OIL-1]|nr:hypothetical protein [Pseudomonas sp. OIL-1]
MAVVAYRMGPGSITGFDVAAGIGVAQARYTPRMQAPLGFFWGW